MAASNEIKSFFKNYWAEQDEKVGEVAPTTISQKEVFITHLSGRVSNEVLPELMCSLRSLIPSDENFGGLGGEFAADQIINIALAFLPGITEGLRRSKSDNVNLAEIFAKFSGLGNLSATEDTVTEEPESGDALTEQIREEIRLQELAEAAAANIDTTGKATATAEALKDAVRAQRTKPAK